MLGAVASAVIHQFGSCRFCTSVGAMLPLITLHAEISGDIARIGYGVGSLGLLVITTVLFFGLRLSRASKSAGEDPNG